MIKQSLFASLAVLFLTACSLKMPEFSDILSFSSSNNYEELLKEANTCQDIEKDNEKLVCYKKIENINSFAQIRLGTYYLEQKDFDRTIKYLNKAKDSGNLYANLPIALLYYRGEAIKKDINKSFELLNEASNIDPVAAFQLSKFYTQGINTQVDIEKGLGLLEFAAQKDVRDAQEVLSNIYKQGLFDVAKDQVKFEYWQNRAKKNLNDRNLKIYIL